MRTWTDGNTRTGDSGRRPRETGTPVREREGVNPHVARRVPAPCEFAEEGAAPCIADEAAVSDEDHAGVAAREHDVHAVEHAEEPGAGRAYGRDDHVRGFVALRRDERVSNFVSGIVKT